MNSTLPVFDLVIRQRCACRHIGGRISQHGTRPVLWLDRDGIITLVLVLAQL